MIGCNQIEISPLALEVASQQCITLRTAQTAPENPKLGQINFTLKVSPFDDANESLAVEGRHKGGKKILATVILRVLGVDNLRPPQLPAKTRSVSVKLRMDKQKFSTKTKKKTMIRKLKYGLKNNVLTLKRTTTKNNEKRTRKRPKKRTKK